MEGNNDEKPKTQKQLEKEAKKAAKLAKFAEKQAKASIKKPAENQPKEKTSFSKEKKADKKDEHKVITYDIDTPVGEKKDVTVDLPSQYSPKYVEASWYAWWKKEGFFKPEYGGRNSLDNPKGKFVMIIPPPNVTGNLHLGHALTGAIEDAICRWNRMKGKTTLYVPGCDHAGIATQVVVEKKIAREEGLTRHQLGREEFLKRVWEWKNQKGGNIYSQIERMGSSYDWDRVFFSMDENLQTAVTETFVRLHEDDTIYRSNRLVNWSCTLKSAISDIEVEKKELTGRTELSVPGYEEKVEFGVLISFIYKVADSDEKVVVATTRIETMLGDTAVAVHPEDTRYKHLHGKLLVHPFVDRKMPIVADDFVERDFGTGCVKITPAHEVTDYEVGKRHNLPFVNILTDDGCIVPGYGQFSGMKRFDARKKILEVLKANGSYVETKENPMVVPTCSRSKDIIEPLLKPQWYVKSTEMAEKAVKSVQTGELEIIPKMHEKTWYHWMSEIRDWCISRQLWWGHRIPAYFVKHKDTGIPIHPEDSNTCWVTGRTEEEAYEKAATQFNIAKNKLLLEQDPDVLDTWFSAGLFPFSVMGWPEKTSDLEQFYPNTMLETGHDILFFWVARMVFMGQKIMGKLPFKQVYLHAMVRDPHGRKMSKSLGNVIDPMDVVEGISLEELHKQLEQNPNIDQRELKKAKEGQKRDYPNGIPECGMDALRFGLCAYTVQGRDINLDILRMNGYRNFCNKLWNATKFALMNLKAPFEPMPLSELQAIASSSSATSTFLKRLEAHLDDYSYLCGHEPSIADAQLCQRLRPKSLSQYSNVLRWYNHMSSFSVHEKESFPRLKPMVNLPLIEKASLTIADQWMLSQLALAVKECNVGFEEFNFNRVTTALYNLWWYNICDVYLECIKPIFQSTDEASNLTRNVLYVCLHTGLRLISPFMPFLSEELFQRLPQPGSPSIVVAPYPEVSDYEGFVNTDAEDKFKFGLKIIGEVRSAKAKYDIPKSKIELSLQTDKPDIQNVLEQLTGEISTLSLASDVKVSDEKPSGSIPTPVSKDVVVWMRLQGLVDLTKCEERLNKKLQDSQAKLDALIKDMNKESYSKVPEDIKIKNDDKKKILEAEIEKNQDAISQLQQM